MLLPVHPSCPGSIMPAAALSIPDQSGRVAIVTGANSGIGFETARELARAGATVVLACRSEARATEAMARLNAESLAGPRSFIPLDLADLDSVEAFATSFLEAHDRLDILVNNAGVMVPPRGTTKQGFELQLGVNHFGHFALTGRLLPRLLATEGSRVVNVSSIAHRQGRMRFDDLNYEQGGYTSWGAYGQSKLANLLFTLGLHRRLEAAGASTIAVASHPGVTSTNLQRHMGFMAPLVKPMCMDAPDGAKPSLMAATDPTVKGNEYFGPTGFMEMWGDAGRVGRKAKAERVEDADRLWAASVEATGVDYAALT